MQQHRLFANDVTPMAARRSTHQGSCTRVLLLALACGVVATSLVVTRSATGLAPCPGVLRLDSDEDVILSGVIEALANGISHDCASALWPEPESSSYTVDVVGNISSNCGVETSDAIPTTTADTGLLADDDAAARATVTFYGTDPNDEDILGEVSAGTYISASFHYAADFDVWASDGECNGTDYPGADGELIVDPLDDLTVEIPFSVVKFARFEADSVLTVGGPCVESSVTGTWRIDKEGSSWFRTGTVSVEDEGTDTDSRSSFIAIGEYTFTATLHESAKAEVCLDTCGGYDERICTHTVDLDIDLEFEEFIICPWCP